MANSRHFLRRCPKARDGLIFRRIDEDYVVYDPVADITTLLNLSAAAVLDLCDGSHSVSEIASEIAEACGGALDDIRPKVDKSLRDLVMRNLLE